MKGEFLNSKLFSGFVGGTFEFLIFSCEKLEGFITAVDECFAFGAHVMRHFVKGQHLFSKPLKFTCVFFFFLDQSPSLFLLRFLVHVRPW